LNLDFYTCYYSNLKNTLQLTSTLITDFLRVFVYNLEDYYKSDRNGRNIMDILMQDTIAAVSTPPGEGGVGIVRISGDKALKIASEIIRTKNNKTIRFQSRKAHFGLVMDPETSQVIDEVLVIYMPAPNSYTTQDVVEVNCHGGPVVLKRVLNLVISCGARPAEPGEFTKRAFLGGRLDLTQAEAVMDLIKARTDQAGMVAMSQLKGVLSERINHLREDLINFMLDLEVRIDFCEDDVSPLDENYKENKISDVLKSISRILADFEKGKIYRDGIRACIIGPPNAGKSTLLNTLTGEDRAIVTPIPGTTRDRIEETINLRGIPVVIIDTAGLRESDDPVESIGIQKTKEAYENADLILLVIDASSDEKFDISEITRTTGKQKILVVLNKIDIDNRFSGEASGEFFEGLNYVEVSLKEGTNIDNLEKSIIDMISQGNLAPPSDIILCNSRHRDALQRAESHLENARFSVQQGMPDDFITIDLNAALDALGDIVGKVAYEELMDRVFSQFCIGK
jgi:tRNA modification GTPase